MNVENDLIITRDVLISSLKTDKELYDLLSPYLEEENAVVESESKKNLDVAQKLVDSLRTNKNWSEYEFIFRNIYFLYLDSFPFLFLILFFRVAATKAEITELESLFKSTLPVQLKTFFLAQNGNKAFGVDDVATIISGIFCKIASKYFTYVNSIS